MNSEINFEELESLLKGKQSKIGKILQIYPSIVRLKQSGISYVAISEVLNQKGLEITHRDLTSMLHRIRKMHNTGTGQPTNKNLIQPKKPAGSISQTKHTNPNVKTEPLSTEIGKPVTYDWQSHRDVKWKELW